TQIAEGQEDGLGLATGNDHHITHEMGEAGAGIWSPVQVCAGRQFSVHVIERVTIEYHDGLRATVGGGQIEPASHGQIAAQHAVISIPALKQIQQRYKLGAVWACQFFVVLLFHHVKHRADGDVGNDIGDASIVHHETGGA